MKKKDKRYHYAKLFTVWAVILPSTANVLKHTWLFSSPWFGSLMAVLLVGTGSLLVDNIFYSLCDRFRR